MNIDFTQRTVIRDGAAHGFGRAIALAFAERGAAVWACDLLRKESRRDPASLGGSPAGSCEIRQVDVGVPQEVAAFVTEVEAAAGRIDVLVNNAGGVLGQVGRPLEQVSPADAGRSLTSTPARSFTLPRRLRW